MDAWKNALDALAYYASASTWSDYVVVMDPPCGLIDQDIAAGSSGKPGAVAQAALDRADPATEAGQVIIMQTLVFYAHPGTWQGVAFMNTGEDSLDDDRAWTVAGRQLGRRAREAVDQVFEGDAVESGESYQAIDWTEEALEVENLPALIAALDVSFVDPA